MCIARSLVVTQAKVRGKSHETRGGALKMRARACDTLLLQVRTRNEIQRELWEDTSGTEREA